MKFFILLIFNHITTVILLFCMMAFSFSAYSQDKLPLDTLQNNALNDSVDSQENPLIKPKKPTQIDAEIKYKANDSIVLLGNGTAFLHGETEINYQSITLKADYVRVKIDSSLVYAKGTQNEKGEVIGEPVFSEGESSYNSKELMYNLKSKKGYIRHVVTQEGEGYKIGRASCRERV